MIPCTFIRINDTCYNANLIKKIKICDDARVISITPEPIVKMLLIFCDSADIPPLHFYTYYQSIGQIFYDWQHNKSTFFEIPYLTVQDIEDLKNEEIKNNSSA